MSDTATGRLLRCYRCGQEKSEDDFYVDRHNYRGRTGYCRLCHNEYSRARKRRVRKQKPPAPPRLKPDGLPAKLVDLLAIEGGWWHEAALCDRLGAERDSVIRALYRLREAGRVEMRRQELTGTSSYAEWRTS